ncbi:hypothetical protein AN958_05597 [Leucoagaricus sp. SymC.cos]|nr:hypothetical protein AN958_05597 [Leucoagaricus sp. SymC.cos]
MPTTNTSPSSIVQAFKAAEDSWTSDPPQVTSPLPAFALFPLSPVTFHVKVTYPADASLNMHEKEFVNVSLKVVYLLGSFEEPPNYKGQTHITITVTFNTTDGLTFPTTPQVNTQAALRDSLENPDFIDTKFYLYSAKRQGLPTRPKVVYAKSRLLIDSSSYLTNLLSTESGFDRSGSPCNLREESNTEMAKLVAEKYEYDSDSDLESLPDDEADNEDTPQNALIALQQSNEVSNCNQDEQEADSASDAFEHAPSPSTSQEVVLTPASSNARAFAINGTAHRT